MVFGILRHWRIPGSSRRHPGAQVSTLEIHRNHRNRPNRPKPPKTPNLVEIGPNLAKFGLLSPVTLDFREC